jgi:hypothetical protein
MRAILVGTGPSLTPEAIHLVNSSNVPKFVCNLAFKDVRPDVFYANNKEFWAIYGKDLKHCQYPKYAYCQEAMEYGAQILKGEWKPSLSQDPEVLHWGHGSGYELLGVAYLAGVTEAILIGYDLRFPKGYDGKNQVAGGDRHYFGEYVKELQHWTRLNIGNGGELNGLLECYRTINTSDLGLRIVNCSPGSALDFFEMGRLEEYI